MKKFLVIAATITAATSTAHANSFTNGDFSRNTGAGQVSDGTTVAGWYVPNGGYSFLFADGTLDTTPSIGQYGGLELWGAHNGGNTVIPASPSGAWDVAIDGDFQVEPLSQDITGLTVGKTYTVGFNYAYAQQQGFDGDTIQSVTVNLGSDGATAQTTPSNTNPDHNFTGWNTTSFNFVATNAAETLSFLANGNLPVPPFAVISGVTFTPDTAVPEPATWVMMLAGVAGMGAVYRRRRRVSLFA